MVCLFINMYDAEETTTGIRKSALKPTPWYNLFGHSSAIVSSLGACEGFRGEIIGDGATSAKLILMDLVCFLIVDGLA